MNTDEKIHLLGNDLVTAVMLQSHYADELETRVRVVCKLLTKRMIEVPFEQRALLMATFIDCTDNLLTECMKELLTSLNGQDKLVCNLCSQYGGTVTKADEEIPMYVIVMPKEVVEQVGE